MSARKFQSVKNNLCKFNMTELILQQGQHFSEPNFVLLPLLALINMQEITQQGSLKIKMQDNGTPYFKTHMHD